MVNLGNKWSENEKENQLPSTAEITINVLGQCFPKLPSYTNNVKHCLSSRSLAPLLEILPQ